MMCDHFVRNSSTTAFKIELSIALSENPCPPKEGDQICNLINVTHYMRHSLTILARGASQEDSTLSLGLPLSDARIDTLMRLCTD